MLTSNREEEDEFFDTAEFLESEASIKGKEEELDYEIWRNEPQSVTKRRERFLSGMGFAEFASSRAAQDVRNNGLERLSELSGAVQSCGNGHPNGKEGDNQEKSSNKEIFNMEETNRCIKYATNAKECENFDVDKKRIKRWWKVFVNHTKDRAKSTSSQSKTINENSKKGRVKVTQKKTKVAELTALYIRQEFRAHEGFIWAMKFSPDGRYLASGGEDGVVRIWRVKLDDSSSSSLLNEVGFDGTSKPSGQAAVLLPKKIFQIQESPIQEFHGHSSDVLDLAWSNSRCLLSSSMDKTVRLWQVGCDRCVNVFHHPNYVTCIQFNPVDENYFISGSVDGKVRIWGVAEKRVVDWADVRDVITAISYHPNGKGFLVGSVFGTCSLYEALGEHCLLDAQIHVEGRKKASGKRITGIQFSRDNFQRVMITSEDSKLRMYSLDDLKMVQKYKAGPQNSGSQTSASFTSSGERIVSIGEDSRVYLWNHDRISDLSSKEPKKSIQSYENFSSEGVSVAIPWPGSGPGKSGTDSFQNPPEVLSSPRDHEGFFFGSWFNAEKASATWPEEKLPHQRMPFLGENGSLVAPETWGLVIVTAGFDGIMRTFHNFGLPIRV